MYHIHLYELQCMLCPRHAGVKENDKPDRLTGKAATTSVFHLGMSEVLTSLRHFLREQSQGHHTMDCVEDRGITYGTKTKDII